MRKTSAYARKRRAGVATTIPTTDGQPLAVGAHLRYRRNYKINGDGYEWRERTGIVTSIDEADSDVRVTLDADAGYQHHARFIRLNDGSVQMCASDYLAEILAPKRLQRAGGL